MDKFKIKDSEKTEIFRVNSKYFDLTDKEKLEVLLPMDEWVKTELKKLKNTPSNSDYAKLAKWVHDCVSFGGTVEQVEDYLRKNFAYSQNVV